jgi:ABC-type transporter Mla subunit MlaD
MVTLEQVRQLETKIGKAIDYVSRVSDENARLRGELDGSEKRVVELEDTVQRFREEQGRIEEGILAAMKRLDQFEDLISEGLSNVQAVVAAAAPVAPSRLTSPAKAEPVAPVEGPSGEEPGKGPSAEKPVDRKPSREGPPGEAAHGEDPDEGEPPLQPEEAGETEELDIF